MVREVKNLRARTKNFWFVFSGKHAPQSAHLWFANRERRYAKQRKGHCACVDFFSRISGVPYRIGLRLYSAFILCLCPKFAPCRFAREKTIPLPY
ncbi:DUF1661 domain-containing protein [Porphyromonas gulae]|uniref:DUF1661 domain-containing protein n=1 Tax=Porphyromonas gulae TaxID=111105 RepID=UPI0026E9A304|nr:DUF1661 domain-containing protein [Porphyromonas gulae]